MVLVSDVLGRPSEVFVYRHATGLQKYECHVAASQHRNGQVYPHPHVHLLDATAPVARFLLRIRYAARYRRRPSREAVRSWQLADLSKRLQVDLIHVHFLWSASMALEAVQATGATLFVTAHGTDVNSALVDSRYRDSLQPVFQTADRILAVSDFIAGRLIEIGCEAGKIERLYLGAPIPNRVSPPEDDREIRVVCVASFRAVKGHRFLVRAFAQAAQSNDRLRLILIGEGPERAQIELLANEVAIRERITFMGSLGPAEVQQVLSEAHIYAQHSIAHRETDPRGNPRLSEEALGISFVEAAGQGLPLIGTRSGGIPEICRDAINGFLVEPEDIEAMAQRIGELAAQPQLRHMLGQRGRALVNSEFNQATQLARLEMLYDDVTESSPPALPQLSQVEAAKT